MVSPNSAYAVGYIVNGVQPPIWGIRACSSQRTEKRVVVGLGAAADADGTTVDPYFSATRLAWLERGRIFAYAHVRGGGEFGEDWHRAGMKSTKQHSIDDMIACARYLIEHKYTSTPKLGIWGGSAGGIVIGGFIDQRPDLIAAAIDDVGSNNALRQEFSPNGPGNVPEFGTVKTQEGFKALYAMDAIAHVKDETPYPAVLLETGINDPRVSPWGRFCCGGSEIRSLRKARAADVAPEGQRC